MRVRVLALAASPLVIAAACESFPEVVNSGAPGATATTTATTGTTGAGGDGGSLLPTTSSQGGGTSGEGGAGGGPGPACGDGTVDPGEACDDGNGESGDGCTGTCDAIEVGFACIVPGQPCVSTVVCGDGKITGDETCDDQNTTPADGCDASCHVEVGWQCPVVGVACIAALCGDSILAGDEECDDGNPGAGDGCSDTCQLEVGFKCDVPGQPCVPTVCGDGVAEGSEPCDDGNNDMGDGCTPFCVVEPDCSQPGPCTTTCGDGIKLPNGAEECEDGNTNAGDGCSPTCEIEPGFACVDVSSDPQTLDLPIVIRDFLIAHPDFENFLGNDLGIVTNTLGVDGKPVYANPGGTTPTTSGQANFDQWYRDVPGVNQTILQTITLNKQGGVFQFSDATFFPIDGQGWGNEGNVHNFHFTSEVRYWFEYKGTEQLAFTGDDDVWVYVNKKLAVNLGGVHGAQSGGITLDAGNAVTFGLTIGDIFEIVVFQAERHTTQSNYQLTLGNFINATSDCQSICGDGIKTPDEACDDGVNDGSYGSCNADCTWGPFCGDGNVDAGFEDCDDGANVTPYGNSGCAPGCKPPATCGDGTVDSLFGEKCDDGTNDGGYNECDAGCVLGPRCGDGVLQANEGEECDDGNKINGDGCDADCTSTIPG